MKLAQLVIKEKIYNFLMKNGNKQTCENKFTKTVKSFQKTNKKSHVEIFRLGIVNSSPITRMRIIKNKKRKKRKIFKEFPYVLNKKSRIFLGIKSILKISTKNLYEEFLLNAKNKGNLLKTKEVSHIHALSKKKYIFFRWFF